MWGEMGTSSGVVGVDRGEKWAFFKASFLLHHAYCPETENRQELKLTPLFSRLFSQLLPSRNNLTLIRLCSRVNISRERLKLSMGFRMPK